MAIRRLRAPTMAKAATTSQRRTLRPKQKRVLPHLARRNDEELASALKGMTRPDGSAVFLFRHFSVEARVGLRSVGAPGLFLIGDARKGFQRMDLVPGTARRVRVGRCAPAAMDPVSHAPSNGWPESEQRFQKGCEPRFGIHGLRTPIAAERLPSSPRILSALRVLDILWHYFS
jgi:hypothetical protein